MMLQGRDSGNDFFIPKISDSSGTFPFLIYNMSVWIRMPNNIKRPEVAGSKKNSTGIRDCLILSLV